MSEYSWMDNPTFKDIDPAKLELLMNFAENAKGQKPENILSLLMQANASMKKENLDFSKSEKDLLIDVLTEGMSAEDKKKVDLIKSFAARNRK